MRNKIVSYLLVFCMSLLVVVGFAPTTVQASDSGLETVDISSEVYADYTLQVLQYGKFNRFLNVAEGNGKCAEFNFSAVDQSDTYNARVISSFDLGVVVNSGVRVSGSLKFFVSADDKSLFDLNNFSFVAYGVNEEPFGGIFPTYDYYVVSSGEIVVNFEFVTNSELRYFEIISYFNVHRQFQVSGASIICFSSGAVETYLTSYNGNSNIIPPDNIDVPTWGGGPSLDSLPSIDSFVPDSSNPFMVTLGLFTNIPVVVNMLLIVSVVGVMAYVVFGKRS